MKKKSFSFSFDSFDAHRSIMETQLNVNTIVHYLSYRYRSLIQDFVICNALSISMLAAYDRFIHSSFYIFRLNDFMVSGYQVSSINMRHYLTCLLISLAQRHRALDDFTLWSAAASNIYNIRFDISGMNFSKFVFLTTIN